MSMVVFNIFAKQQVLAFSRMIFLVLLLFILSVAALPRAYAADLERGLAAYAAGDYETALTEFLVFAKQGDKDLQYALGTMYHGGLGTPMDGSKAVLWLRRAAEQDHLAAQYLLATILGNGNGVPQDHREAVEWYFRATDWYHGAWADLGLLYQDSKVLPSRFKELPDWYPRTASAGFALANYKNGIALMNGQGVDKDMQGAAILFRTAAESGHAEAHYQLGRFYEIGEGVPASNIRAYQWYEIAAGMGVDKAEQRLNNLSSQMTEDEIRQAMAAAEECLSSEYWECGN